MKIEILTIYLEQTENSEKQFISKNENLDSDGFKKVIRKKIEQYLIAVNLPLKAITQYRYLHVYNLLPETTADDIIKHLMAQNILRVQCEQMISKYPEKYSSFKLTFPIEQ